MKWLFSDTEKDFGEVVYRFWSAVSHSTLYGLTQSCDRNVPQTPFDSLRTVGMSVSIDQVQTTLATVGLAYVEVGKSHRGLFGWRSDPWDRTVANYLAGLRAAPTTGDAEG